VPGQGLGAAIGGVRRGPARDAYAKLVFMRISSDDIETMLARTDLEIALAYEILAPPELRRFFPRSSAANTLRPASTCWRSGIQCVVGFGADVAALHPSA